MKRLYLILILLAFSSVSLCLTGCQEDDSSVNDEQDPIETQASEDAADIIAETVGGDNGGLNDQLTDLDQLLMDNMGSGVQSSQSVQAESPIDAEGSFQRTFNPSDTTWTVYVTRKYSNEIWKIEGEWTRGFHVWFKKDGVKKQYPKNLLGELVIDEVYSSFISDSCTGIYNDPFITHELKKLAGSWICSIDTSEKTATLNTVDNHERAALDTLRFGEALRTSDHDLTLTIEDLKFKLFKRPERVNRLRARRHVQPISGKVSGVYNAYITFKLGEIEDERTVTRNFVVEYGEGLTSQYAKVTITDEAGNKIERETDIETGKVVTTNTN